MDFKMSSFNTVLLLSSFFLIVEVHIHLSLLKLSMYVITVTYGVNIFPCSLTTKYLLNNCTPATYLILQQQKPVQKIFSIRTMMRDVTPVMIKSRRQSLIMWVQDPATSHTLYILSLVMPIRSRWCFVSLQKKTETKNNNQLLLLRLHI